MSYRFEVTCPRDGAPVEHIADGASTGWETRAVVRCTQCQADFVIAVHLYADDVTPGARKPIEHGTEKGYQQHRRRGDGACTPCLEAHNAYTAGQKAAARAAGQMELVR